MYNPTAPNTWDFPKITTIWSQDIYFVVDMDYVDEGHVVMFTVKLRENRSDRIIFTSKKKSVLKLVLQNVTVIYDMRIRPEVRKNILRKI